MFTVPHFLPASDPHPLYRLDDRRLSLMRRPLPAVSLCLGFVETQTEHGRPPHADSGLLGRGLAADLIPGPGLGQSCSFSRVFGPQPHGGGSPLRSLGNLLTRHGDSFTAAVCLPLPGPVSQCPGGGSLGSLCARVPTFL